MSPSGPRDLPPGLAFAASRWIPDNGDVIAINTSNARKSLCTLRASAGAIDTRAMIVAKVGDLS
jgi:hypothetical protein